MRFPNSSQLYMPTQLQIAFPKTQMMIPQTHLQRLVFITKSNGVYNIFTAGSFQDVTQYQFQRFLNISKNKKKNTQPPACVQHIFAFYVYVISFSRMQEQF